MSSRSSVSCRFAVIRLLLLGMTAFACVPISHAATLFTRTAPLTVDDSDAFDVPGCNLYRTDADADTLWFRVVVQPTSDMTTERYSAGLLFLHSGAPLGIGNAPLSSCYSVWGVPTGELDLHSRTPEPGTFACAVRRGDITTLLVRVHYQPNALDSVTVWLSPDSTQTEYTQSDSLRTTFLADASFARLALGEVGGAAGWTFSHLAVATTRAELFGPEAFGDVTTFALGAVVVGEGVAWADYDGDGDPDLAASDVVGPVQLFRNDVAAGFTSVTTTAFASSDASDAFSWGDVDNDGDLDLYVSRSGLPNQLLRNDGRGQFTDVTSGPLADAGSTVMSVWGDMDNDGDLDLFVADFDGTDHLLRNDGAAGFKDVTPPGMAGPGNTTSAVWGDIDGDGDLDLFVAHANRPNHLYRNDRRGVFTDLVQPAIARPGSCFGAAFGDYDDDGDLDLFIVGNGEPNRLLRNDHGVFTEVTSGALAEPGSGVGCAWADVDLDGDLDLLVTHYGESDRLFRNDGDGQFVDATGALGLASFDTGCAWGDMDGDGDPDLYVANEGDGNHLYRNLQTTGNHWLQVRLAGTTSNRAGIGAQVRIVSGGVVQMRELSGGSGLGSQDALVAAFGLGGRTRVDSLVVHWPSGIYQYLPPITLVDRAITLTEPPLALAVGEGAAVELRCAPATPNPFRAATHVAYQLPRAAQVRATVARHAQVVGEFDVNDSLPEGLAENWTEVANVMSRLLNGDRKSVV